MENKFLEKLLQKNFNWTDEEKLELCQILSKSVKTNIETLFCKEIKDFVDILGLDMKIQVQYEKGKTDIDVKLVEKEEGKQPFSFKSDPDKVIIGHSTRPIIKIGALAEERARAKSRTRYGKQLIEVTLPDGEIIFNKNVTKTFVDFVNKVGAERIKQLNIVCRGRNVVLDYSEMNEADIKRGRCKPLEKDNLYCYADTKNIEKYDVMQEIIKRLDLNIKIKIIEA